MRVDVIIPTYKPGKELFVLMDMLSKQTVPVENIILMNTGERLFEATEAEADFPAKYADKVQVHCISRDAFDHGATRHTGVGYSEADVFVMMTQDACPVDEFLLERLTSHLQGQVAVAYARQLPGENSSEFEKISRKFNYPAVSRIKGKEDVQELGIKAYFCSNVCAAYRRDIYEELGGFVRRAIFNEDMLYAAKAIQNGYQIAYEAEAEVVHAHNYTNMQQLRRNFDLGVSQALHPEVFGKVSSESEGKKLVLAAFRDMKERKRLSRFPAFIMQCIYKYVGYYFGKHYQSLSQKTIYKFTMNKNFWDSQSL